MPGGPGAAVPDPRYLHAAGHRSRHDDDRGSDGEILRHTGHVVVGQDTGLYTAARAASGLAGASTVTQAGDRMLAVVPVNGHTEKVAGAVLLSRPLAPLDDHIRRLWAGLGTVAFLAVLAAVVLAVALAHWVGRPLRSLEVAAEALGAGELGARADPRRRRAATR